MRLLPPLCCAVVLLSGAACSKKTSGNSTELTPSKADCKDPKGQPASPLVVDWSAEERSDLELAMKDGLAVLAYSCQEIRVLSDCKVEGSYKFTGLQPKEDTRQVTTTTEVAAVLPRSATGKTFGSLAGELGKGHAIDIATVTVGRKRAGRDAVKKSELKGKCDGATHVVKGATVGAFAFVIGDKGKTRVAGEIFAVGTSKTSNTSSVARSVSGSVQACKQANPDAAKPPAQCDAAVSLEMIPVSD